MGIKRYSLIENSSRKREIVLLKAFPCVWGRCSFCDYIHDNSENEDEINASNKEVLAQVTGCCEALQVINSGSCFEIPAASMQMIKDTVVKHHIKQLYFEAYWSYRHRLHEIENFFQVPIIFITGIETFDEHFRNTVLKKGIVFSDVSEVRKYFQSVCLMVGIQGQTKDMIRRDIDILMHNFLHGTINFYVNNTTSIKADLELQQWFREEFAWLKNSEKVDILFDNTDFGVGGPASL